METNFIIAGFGGQGVLLAGEVLANAFMLDEKNVTWYPSYGAEMRGGTVNCEIVMNDSEDVSSVNKEETDFVLALNQASFDRFLPKVKKGGCIIANSTLVEKNTPRNDIKYVFVPMTDLADELGNAKMTNILSLGVLLKTCALTKLASVEQALDNVLPLHRKSFLPLNIKALNLGYAYDFSLVCS